MTPRKETEESSVPSNQLFRYRWRIPFDGTVPTGDEAAESAFAVGDEVWVKLSPPSCTKQWMPGKVTRIVSKHTVCVDGTPRHVRDIRKQRRPVVHRGPLDCMHADGLRGRPAAEDQGEVPSGAPVYGNLGETGFSEQIIDQEAPEMPYGGDDLPGEPSQGAVLGETDETQSELDDELGVEEQFSPRRSQRVKRRPRYLDWYKY